MKIFFVNFSSRYRSITKWNIFQIFHPVIHLYWPCTILLHRRRRKIDLCLLSFLFKIQVHRFAGGKYFPLRTRLAVASNLNKQYLAFNLIYIKCIMFARKHFKDCKQRLQWHLDTWTTKYFLLAKLFCFNILYCLPGFILQKTQLNHF